MSALAKVMIDLFLVSLDYMMTMKIDFDALRAEWALAKAEGRKPDVERFRQQAIATEEAARQYFAPLEPRGPSGTTTIRDE